MRITTYQILNTNYVDFGMNVISYRDELPTAFRRLGLVIIVVISLI